MRFSSPSQVLMPPPPPRFERGVHSSPQRWQDPTLEESHSHLPHVHTAYSAGTDIRNPTLEKPPLRSLGHADPGVWILVPGSLPLAPGSFPPDPSTLEIVILKGALPSHKVWSRSGGAQMQFLTFFQICVICLIIFVSYCSMMSYYFHIPDHILFIFYLYSALRASDEACPYRNL